jgi:hypothetical protein
MKTLEVALCLILSTAPAWPQKTQPAHESAPKYDSQTETVTKGVVDDVTLVTLGARKDFTALAVKSGDEIVRVLVSPKPFQDEVGLSFSKGDEIAVTGSKVKQGTSDVILAREVVKGADTVQLRDDKGRPVWDERTGK